MNNLKVINMKKDRTCYYFNNIIKIEDFDKILLYEKSHTKNLACDLSYKNCIDAKLL